MKFVGTYKKVGLVVKVVFRVYGSGASPLRIRGLYGFALQYGLREGASLQAL